MLREGLLQGLSFHYWFCPEYISQNSIDEQVVWFLLKVFPIVLNLESYVFHNRCASEPIYGTFKSVPLNCQSVQMIVASSHLQYQRK